MVADLVYLRAQLNQPPLQNRSYSAVRAMLRVLEEKGHVRHEEQGMRYVFLPTLPQEKAKRSAVKHLLATFFNGSTEQAVAALLDASAAALSREELNRMAEMIEKARKDGK